MSTHDFQPGDIVSFNGKDGLVVKCPDKHLKTYLGHASDICWLKSLYEHCGPVFVFIKDVTLVRRSNDQGICQDCHGKREILLLTSIVPCQCVVDENGK